MHTYFSEKTDFYGSSSPHELVSRYGSPLYVYNENILRRRCRDMTGFIPYPNYKVNYSVKPMPIWSF